MEQVGTLALGRSPFAAIYDPALRIRTRAFESAFADVLGRVRRGQRLIALTGPAGAGKTLLLRAVENAMAGMIVRRVDRGELLSDALAGQPAVLLVDEADRADSATLTRIARGEWPQPVVIACARDCLQGLSPAVRPRLVHLKLLSAAESRALVRGLLARTGRESLFTADALEAASAGARGNARALVQIAGGAWAQARMDGEDVVDADHVQGALAMRRLLHGAEVRLAPARGSRLAALRIRVPLRVIGAAAAMGLAGVAALTPLPSGPDSVQHERSVRSPLAAAPHLAVRSPTPQVPVSPPIMVAEAPADVRRPAPEVTELVEAPRPTLPIAEKAVQVATRATIAPPAAQPPPMLASLDTPRRATTPKRSEPAKTELASRLLVLTPPRPRFPAEPPVQTAAAEPPAPAGEHAQEHALIEVTATRDDVRAARDAAIQARDAMQAARLARRG